MTTEAEQVVHQHDFAMALDRLALALDHMEREVARAGLDPDAPKPKAAVARDFRAATQRVMRAYRALAGLLPPDYIPERAESEAQPLPKPRALVRHSPDDRGRLFWLGAAQLEAGQLPVYPLEVVLHGGDVCSCPTWGQCRLRYGLCRSRPCVPPARPTSIVRCAAHWVATHWWCRTKTGIPRPTSLANACVAPVGASTWL